MKKILLFPICWIIAIASMTHIGAQSTECRWDSSSSTVNNSAIVVLHTGEHCDISIPEGGSITVSATAGYDVWRINSRDLFYEITYTEEYNTNLNDYVTIKNLEYIDKVWDVSLNKTINNKGESVDRESISLYFADGEKYRPMSTSPNDWRSYQESVTRNHWPASVDPVNMPTVLHNVASNYDKQNYSGWTDEQRQSFARNNWPQPETGPYSQAGVMYDGRLVSWSADDWDNYKYRRIPTDSRYQTCDAATPRIKWFKEASSFKVVKTYFDGTKEYVEYLVVDNEEYYDQRYDEVGYPMCHRDPPMLVTIPDRSASANMQPVQQGTQSRGNDDHGTSTDPSNRQEDVGKPTQTTPPVNDSDKIAALQQNIVDLQADVVSLNALVDKLLKENAALRHDNAVLSTLIDANQRNIIVVDEVVSEEATEVSQGTTETVSTPQVETSVTVSVDISGYEFVDIAPDGRPRIISTVDVQIHPDTRKRFLSEWGKFYDEHRDIEWWDCAGWSPYESPPVAVPVSEINANPHNHCDLRKP